MQSAKIEKQTLSRVIRIDGEYRAQRGSGGFEVSKGASSFVDELQINGAPSAVLGEFFIRVNGDGDSDFNTQRQQLGLTVYPVAPGVSRACLAFARFLVIKDYSALPNEMAVRRVGLGNYVSVYGICSDPTESMLLTEALRLDVVTSKSEYNLDGDDSLLVVDKVYVANCSRRCGISEYIHANLADIAHVFIGSRPKLVVLNCGDFSNEHSRLGITETEYKTILKKHYARAGYKSLGGVSPYVMWKLL